MKNLKNILILILVIIIWSALVFTGGYFYNGFYGEKPPPEIVYKDKIVDKIVYRNIKTMTPAEKDNEILHYDTDPFLLDIQPNNLDKTNFRITGELYKRKAYRDVRIECGNSGNWKFYVGVTAAVIVGSVVTYKLINK